MTLPLLRRLLLTTTTSSSSRPIITRHGPHAERELQHLQQQLSQLFLQHKIQKAYDLSAHYVAKTTSVYGPDHPAVASALGDSALMALELAHLDHALALFQSSLSVYSRAGLLSSPGSATVHLNYSRALKLKSATDPANSVKYSQQAVDACTHAHDTLTKLKGAMHPDTAVALRRLGNAHFTAGHHAKATSLLRSALELVLPLRNGKTAAALNDLGLVVRAKDPHEAEALMVRAIELQSDVLAQTGYGAKDLIAYKNNLCELWEYMGQHEKALALRENVIATSQQLLKSTTS